MSPIMNFANVRGITKYIVFARPLLAAIVLAAIASAPAHSQDFIGKWTGNGGNSTLTLTLERGTSNAPLAGDMRGGPLEAGQHVVRARIDSGTVRGHARSHLHQWGFEGRLDGQTMRLRLVLMYENHGEGSALLRNDNRVPSASEHDVIYTLARGDQPPPGNPAPATVAAIAAAAAAEGERAREAAEAAASSVTGTWTAALPTGGTMTLTLREQNDDELRVTGTLERGGITYQFTGNGGGGSLAGDASATNGTLRLSGLMSEGKLSVQVKDIGSNGRAVAGTTIRLTFVRR